MKQKYKKYRKRRRNTAKKKMLRTQVRERMIYEAGLRSAYRKGKLEGMKQVLPIALAHNRQKIVYPDADLEKTQVQAIIAAKNEAKTIGLVIENVREAGVQQITVVANGCTDDTVSIACEQGVQVIEYNDSLGYDVGRAIGLASSSADVNLVLDADFILPAQDIKPFINAVAHGVDIALNDLNPLYMKYATIDHISIIKYNLNLALEREDLGINTLTAVPHALSRKAVNTIGAKMLAIPPKALVKAVLAKLNIRAVHTVDVFKPNIIRPEVHQFNGQDLVADLIIGDHLEALAYYLAHTDWRGGRTDLGRRRDLI